MHLNIIEAQCIDIAFQQLLDTVLEGLWHIPEGRRREVGRAHALGEMDRWIVLNRRVESARRCFFILAGHGNIGRLP